MRAFAHVFLNTRSVSRSRYCRRENLEALLHSTRGRSPAIPLQRVRDGALVWFIAEYEGKEKIKVTNSGSGNFDEFKVCANARLSRARALPPASDPSPSHAISMLFVCD